MPNQGTHTRRLRVLAWAVFGLAVIGLFVTVWLDALNHGRGSDRAVYIFFVFPIVGVVLATKRPENALGWLMLAIGVAFVSPGTSYATYALITHDGRLPGAGLALAISGPMWVPFIGLSGYLLLLFPDGHLPSSRWRWFAWACGIGLVALFLTILFAPGTYEDSGFAQVANPIGIEPLRPIFGPLLTLAVFAPLVVVGGAAALIVRTRRTTDPIQRQQLRWLGWAAGVIAIAYVGAFIPGIFGVSDSGWNGAFETIAVGSFLLIPITIGIAVLRYRLYDIDFVIKKTVVFALVAAVIAIVYVGLVIGVGALVGSRSSSVLSAIAAAIVALVFQPVRARARRLADRVVYGQRATPYEVLADFSERVGETYSADDVLPRMARVVAEGIGAERAEVWLRFDGRDHLAAVWPSEGSAAPSPGAADAAFPVEHQGQVLGTLAVVTPANDPMNPAKTKLVTDLAAQAGLVLRNVRLTEELRARLDDLRAAQKRLVAAQDDERRKLERNIHDGAQQQLVALGVKLGLTDRFIDKDPARAHETIAQLQTEAATALEDLRDLARGIYPPLLADEGLEAALAAQARRATLPVEVDVRVPARLAAELEAAVYFSCLECLQNVSKYAGASRATVTVASVDGMVAFEVRDDGRGFDPSFTGFGTGLQGIADRLGALDGTVEVTSAPGEGTTVAGRVPVLPR
jgi:signal transduction histidine kinase